MGTKTIDVPGQGPVEFPDTMSDEEIAAVLRGETKPAGPKTYAASEVPGAALKNLPNEPGRIGAGMAHAASHPLDTIKSMLSIAGVPVTYPAYAGTRVVDWLAGTHTAPRFADTYLKGATDFTNQLKENYGGWDNAKRTFAETPLQPVMDILGLTPAGGAIGKSSFGQAAKAGVGRVADATGHVMSGVPASMIDMFIQGEEGIGPGAIRDVTQAGREGKSNVLRTIMQGVNYDDILARMQSAVSRLGEQRSDAYNSAMRIFKGADAPVHFGRIDQAIARADEMGQYRGQSGTAPPVEKRSPPEIAARDAINGIVEKWRALDPNEFHTAYGFDQMKQELNKFVDTLPENDAMRTPAQAYANRVSQAVRDTIRERAPPEYGAAMDEYGRQSDQMRNLIKEFKVGPNNTNVQALRSLQKIHRRSADVAHGEKENLLRTAMQEAGDTDLMQILAGGQFHPKLPSGIRGAMLPVTLAGVAGGTLGPGALALIASASPRLTGLAGYGAGRAAGIAEHALPGLGSSTKSAMGRYGEMSLDPRVQALTQRPRQSEPVEERARGGALSTRRR